MNPAPLLFAILILAVLFFALKNIFPRLTTVDKIRVTLIALFAFAFLVRGNVGVFSLKVWLKYTRKALKVDYCSRYGKGYRDALAEAFPWYEDVVKARFWILAQGEKSVRLECPTEKIFRERIAEILYPVRIDPNSRLTLKVSAPPGVRFQLIKDSP